MCSWGSSSCKARHIWIAATISSTVAAVAKLRLLPESPGRRPTAVGFGAAGSLCFADAGQGLLGLLPLWVLVHGNLHAILSAGPCHHAELRRPICAALITHVGCHLDLGSIGSGPGSQTAFSVLAK